MPGVSVTVHVVGGGEGGMMQYGRCTQMNDAFIGFGIVYAVNLAVVQSLCVCECASSWKWRWKADFVWNPISRENIEFISCWIQFSLQIKATPPFRLFIAEALFVWTIQCTLFHWQIDKSDVDGSAKSEWTSNGGLAGRQFRQPMHMSCMSLLLVLVMPTPYCPLRLLMQCNTNCVVLLWVRGLAVL